MTHGSEPIDPADPGSTAPDTDDLATDEAADAAARAKKSDTVRMVFLVAAGGVAIWWLVSGIVGLASR